MASERNGTLYCGVTNNLARRVFEHKNGIVEGFTKKNKIHNLVYYECGENIEAAIEREKQIKGGSRLKKLRLIESINPMWQDLVTEL